MDGHVLDESPHSRRVADLATWVEWKEGESVEHATRRCYEQHGRLPDSWSGQEKRLVERDFTFGFSAIRRWYGDRPARVITGAGPSTTVHPHLPRTLSYRETARIMGFPDDWLIAPLRSVGGARPTWGKGITVDAGRWIGYWARQSIEGEPGTITGHQVGDREFEITVSKPVVACGTLSESPSLVAREAITVSEFVSRRRPMSAGAAQQQAPSFQSPPAQVPAQPQVEAPATPEADAPVEVTTEPTSSPELVTEPTETPAEPVIESTTDATPTETEAPAEAPSAAPAQRKRRGRTRTAEVLKRDEQVLAVLTTTGYTRDQVAELTGLSPSLTYQALWRLREAGKAVRDRAGREHVWKRAPGAAS